MLATFLEVYQKTPYGTSKELLLKIVLLTSKCNMRFALALSWILKPTEYHKKALALSRLVAKSSVIGALSHYLVV